MWLMVSKPAFMSACIASTESRRSCSPSSTLSKPSRTTSLVSASSVWLRRALRFALTAAAALIPLPITLEVRSHFCFDARSRVAPVMSA